MDNYIEVWKIIESTQLDLARVDSNDILYAAYC